MTTYEQPDRWAPWWAYVIAIGATNQVHMGIFLRDATATWLRIVFGVASILVVTAVVTLIYRTRNRRRMSRGQH
jgi:undecaprenyl pyrophosphate phosphatase UppP